MKILTHFEQSSPEWKAARAGKVTASRAKDARDRLKSGSPSQKQIAYAAQVAVERICRKPVDMTFENWQMREGHTQEPLARAAYEQATGNVVFEVGAIVDDEEVFLYSPDGIVEDQGLVEIKSIFSPDRMIQIIADGDISDFIDQCNFGLWLTDRNWIDLVIWCPSLESIGLAMKIIRIERDQTAIDALESDLLKFLAMVRENESKLRKAAQAANSSQLLQAA
jgi:exodeoxyribonuclease (lambda-induced)